MPLRVALLHYSDAAWWGGSVRVGELVANNLDRFGVEAHLVFAYGGPGPVSSRARVPCHFIRASGPCDLRGWLEARHLIGRLRPEVLHFVNPVFWLNLSLLDWRGARILHVHGPIDPSQTKLKDKIIWQVMRVLMGGHVCVSEDMRQKVLTAGWAKPERTWVVYNAVDCAAWVSVPGKGEARRALKLPQDVRLLGVVGRQVPEKGCFDALELLRYLPTHYHLAYFGDGPLNGELRRRVEQSGSSRRVHFPGLQDNALPIYGAIDYLVFLSKTEPFGLVIAEAMAAGVPVVGLAGEGGYMERAYPLVTEENALLLARPNGKAGLANTPLSLLQRLAERVVELEGQPAAARAMTERARSWVRERFDVSRQVREIVEIYKTVRG